MIKEKGTKIAKYLTFHYEVRLLKFIFFELFNIKHDHENPRDVASNEAYRFQVISVQRNRDPLATKRNNLLIAPLSPFSQQEPDRSISAALLDNIF